jgi:hypothetical protein
MCQKPPATVWKRGTREESEAVRQRCGKGQYKAFQAPPFPAFRQRALTCLNGAMLKEATRKTQCAHGAHGRLSDYRAQSKDKSL